MIQNKIPNLTTKIKTTILARTFEYQRPDFKHLPTLLILNSTRCRPDPHSRAQSRVALPAPESQEPAALGDENLAVIEKVYQRLKNDEDIKAHPWVRVVEGD